MSRLAHATYAASGLEAERRNLDATVRHEAKRRAELRILAHHNAMPGTTPDPITAYYADRANGVHAAKAP